jgi:2Fe-2S ferredoxin
MPKVIFIQHTGESQVVEVQVGQSVMEAATCSMIRGIIGECGGCCSCATCHVYVDEAWFGCLPPADQMEEGMLEGAVEPGPLSRLSCQLKMTEALNGLVVSIPAGQA